MKRRVFLFVIIAISAAAFAAEPLRNEIRLVVERSLAGEREAIARYQAYALKAEEEGYPAAAALFRAQAKAEGVHAMRFERILREHGHAVPPADPPAPPHGGTEDNLRRAASTEAAERDGIYHDAIETCRLHGKPELAKMFDQTRDSEVEHGNLCLAAARNVDAMKQAKAYYVCGECGYTTDVKLPLCPACRVRHAPERVD